MLIAGDANITKEAYRLNLLQNECVRDTDMAMGVGCYWTLSPVVIEGAAYFVGCDRRIQEYTIAERKWKMVN